jgi:hypothetical protein
MLHYETITERVRQMINKLMESDLLKDYRMVGGTALSLYRGHRRSDDIDLFVDGYDKYIKDDVIKALKEVKPPGVQMEIITNLSFVIMAYLHFKTPKEVMKIDIMNR